MTAGKHLQDRLGSVLLRLHAIERRVAAVTQPPRLAARLADDTRRLAGELERALSDVQEVLAERARLGEEVALAAGRTRLLFELVPVPCLFLDAEGTIEDANPEAVKLLNVSRRHLTGRSFHLYLGAQRELFLQHIQSVSTGEDRHTWTADVRPRERSPIQATLTVAANPEGGLLLVLHRPQGLAGAPLHEAAAGRMPGLAPSA